MNEWISVYHRMPDLDVGPVTCDCCEGGVDYYTWSIDVTAKDDDGNQALAYYDYEDESWCHAELSGALRFSPTQWKLPK